MALMALPQYGLLGIFSASVPTWSSPADSLSVSWLKFQRRNLAPLMTYLCLEISIPGHFGWLPLG